MCSHISYILAKLCRQNIRNVWKTKVTFKTSNYLATLNVPISCHQLNLLWNLQEVFRPYAEHQILGIPIEITGFWLWKYSSILCFRRIFKQSNSVSEWNCEAQKRRLTLIFIDLFNWTSSLEEDATRRAAHISLFCFPAVKPIMNNTFIGSLRSTGLIFTKPRFTWATFTSTNMEVTLRGLSASPFLWASDRLRAPAEDIKEH